MLDGRFILGIVKNWHETPRLSRPATPEGGPANLRPFRHEHEKVPIRVGPLDSPDRHPNRLVETTTSCRLTPCCAGSPSVAATHFRIHASRRRPVRGGRRCMPWSKPNQSQRSELLRGPSDRRSSRPDGAAGPPNGEDVAWKGTETTVSQGRKAPRTHTNLPRAGRSRRTPNISVSKDLARRKNTPTHSGDGAPETLRAGPEHHESVREPHARCLRNHSPRLASESASNFAGKPARSIFATTSCGGNQKSTTFRHPFKD